MAARLDRFSFSTEDDRQYRRLNDGDIISPTDPVFSPRHAPPPTPGGTEAVWSPRFTTRRPEFQLHARSGRRRRPSYRVPTGEDRRERRETGQRAYSVQQRAEAPSPPPSKRRASAMALRLRPQPVVLGGGRGSGSLFSDTSTTFSATSASAAQQQYCAGNNSEERRRPTPQQQEWASVVDSGGAVAVP